MKLQNKNFLYCLFIGILSGIVLGGVFPNAGKSVYFIGEVFIKALLMLVVPLVMTSMVTGISSLGDIRKIGRIGARTMAYYLITTAISVLIGIILVIIIQPGRADTEEARLKRRGGELLTNVSYRIEHKTLILETPLLSRPFDARYQLALLDQAGIRADILKSMMKENPVLMIDEWVDRDGENVVPLSEGKGIRIDLAVAQNVRGKSKSISSVLRELIIGLVPSNLFASMAHNEVLPLIIFSLFLGAVLTTLGQKGRSVILLFEGLNEAIMKMVHLLMVIAPVAIAALIAGRLGNAGGFTGFIPELMGLSKYVVTVLLGLGLHAFIILPMILFFVTRRNIISFATDLVPALSTAFSTASSSATMPLTMECVTQKSRVSNRTAAFVLPLGATINMDGTALYEAVAAIFIAQMYGITLGPVHMVIVFLTATLAAIGAAGIPEAGLVTMMIVLEAVHLPIEGISLILIVDWFLDRCRTTVNVWGDAVGSAVIDRFQEISTQSENKV
ncbi:MAG: dicarboxylate/amino acid:cation symporter [Chlamydiota bacterium]|nr:dicarboxylate/amino acid:cation symporter [Chlamydiota bacterium]